MGTLARDLKHLRLWRVISSNALVALDRYFSTVQRDDMSLTYLEDCLELLPSKDQSYLSRQIFKVEREQGVGPEVIAVLIKHLQTAYKQPDNSDRVWEINTHLWTLTHFFTRTEGWSDLETLDYLRTFDFPLPVLNGIDHIHVMRGSA